MKIVVTGGAGFIGSHLVDYLIEKNHRVAVIDNLLTGRKENLNKKARFYKIDICSPEILQIFKDEKPEIVFHLAALPRVPLSVKEPVLTTKVNITGTVNIFKAALDCGAKRVIFASSSSVYGEQKSLPLKENFLPKPISPYGLQKWAGEQFAKLFVKFYKIPIVSLRYFNVYGPRMDFNSEYSLVIGKFLKQRAENQPLTIYGDGKQTRAFCYITDVIEATAKAAFSEKIKGGEVINIGMEKGYSINYLANLIGGKVVYLPPREGDVKHTKADITLAKELLDWSPKVALEKGIRKTKEWFQKIYKK